MGNVIILVLLAIIILIAARTALKHAKGEGGCCGGGSTVKAKKKKLEGPVVARKVMTIEGMHCENCKNAVENRLNRLEGVAAKVNLKKKTALISLDRRVDDEVLKEAVDGLDYQVISIAERRRD
ncbi:MAG: heavy-metal-associated domain-containing protein [Ruminococcus sp.]|jgi:copper chaperone